MMGEVRRNWWFALVVAVPVLLGAIDNATVTVIFAAGLLALGLAVLPRQRSQNARAAVLACCIALGLVLVNHWRG